MTIEKTVIKTILTYDDRKKILNQKKSVTETFKRDAVEVDGKVTQEEELISTAISSVDVDYTENGIRLAHKNLVATKKAMTEKLNSFPEIPTEELTDDQKKLKLDMAAVIKMDEAEKAQKNREATSEELDKVTKELSELEDEIGTRLKF